MSNIARRIGKLEALLRPEPPRVVGAVSWAGRCFTLVFSDGTKTDEAELPVVDLPAGAAHYESDPDAEILLAVPNGAGSVCLNKRVVGMSWLGVFGYRPGSRLR